MRRNVKILMTEERKEKLKEEMLNAIDELPKEKQEELYQLLLKKIIKK